MTHEHGNQYRVKIVSDNETEELSGWMNNPGEVAQIIAGRRESVADAYWLQVRNIVCPDCQHKELTIVESRLSPNVAENARLPPQSERRHFGSVSTRSSSAGAK